MTTPEAGPEAEERRATLLRWLEARGRSDATALLIWSGAMALAAAGVLLATYVAVEIVLWLGFDWLLPWFALRALAGLAILALLFRGNARTSRAYLESLEFTTGTTSNKVVSVSIPGVGTGSNVNPLAPDSVHSYVKVVTSILYTGPRMAMESIDAARRARRLGAPDPDLDGAATLLEALLAAPSRIPVADLVTLVPAERVAPALERLRALDGVLFLETKPRGVALAQRLREELEAITAPG